MANSCKVIKPNNKLLGDLTGVVEHQAGYPDLGLDVAVDGVEIGVPVEAAVAEAAVAPGQPEL